MSKTKVVNVDWTYCISEVAEWDAVYGDLEDMGGQGFELVTGPFLNPATGRWTSVLKKRKDW